MIAGTSFREVTVQDRLRGAVWGQFVGDAAALGAHWIYDLQELSAKFPGGVLGFENPQPGHYHEGRKPGDQTHYGDGALVLLESIAEVGGFDARAFGKRFVDTFGSSNYRGYLDHATKDTLENYRTFCESNPPDRFDFQQGADDDQLAGASRLASLVARYWREPNLSELVEVATKVCQNNPTAIEYMKFHGLFLVELLFGRDIHRALNNAQLRLDLVAPNLSPEIRQKIQQALGETLEEVTEATLTFGQACPLPQSFPSALHAFLKHSDDFETAILATLRAGGDNAGRAAMLGAWLGAHLGMGAIPKDWRTKLTAESRISAALDRILLDES
jgi:ADP-ribosyl-[dinitrogen reductase] hydrolase